MVITKGNFRFMFDFERIESIIGYTFKDKALLKRCFTHASYSNEHRNCPDNERLEFFGDSIVKFIESEYLYEFLRGDEGMLTALRQKIENNAFFLKAITDSGLDEFVLMGNGQAKNAQHDEKLYSSIFEALVAGIYLDGGLDEAKKFVKKTVIAEYERFANADALGSVEKDFKTALQELAQKSKLGDVVYETLDKSGPDHKPVYRVSVALNGKILAEGAGGSKKIAETAAAKTALSILKNQDGSKL